MPPGRAWWGRVAGFALAAMAGTFGACDDDEPVVSSSSAPSASSSAGPAGLSPELASKVLAKVGDRTITLGDYALILERMDRFERLRYQTEDRRKQLLDELIDVELLAQEAERRGLHERPEARELVRQVLRDELLRQMRTALPPMESIPASEVRRYYDAHRDDFREPERRRIAVIVLESETAADKALKAAEGADAAAFGKLVQERSIEKRPRAEGPEPPVELAGDLGFVSDPKSGVDENPRAPKAVRAAAFEIEKPGQILSRIVEADGKYYVIRLVSVNAARDRSLEDADRTIRVALMRERIRQAEGKLEAELKKKYAVEVDQGALSKVKVPPLDEAK